MQQRVCAARVTTVAVDVIRLLFLVTTDREEGSLTATQALLAACAAGSANGPRSGGVDVQYAGRAVCAPDRGLIGIAFGLVDAVAAVLPAHRGLMRVRLVIRQPTRERVTYNVQSLIFRAQLKGGFPCTGKATC